MGRTSPDNYSFSHSEMTTFKECRRKWWLQYFWKLRRRGGISRPAAARDTGTLVHAALETFYVAGSLRTDTSESLMLSYLSNARDEDLMRAEEEDRKTVTDIHETARILCTGYVEWLHETGADVGILFDPHPSEVELRAPGPVPGTEIMGIIDLFGTDERSGDLIVMDTKCTDSIDTMLKTLHIQEQGPMYAVLAKITDPNPQRGFKVIWNMIKRTKQTARAKPPFYQRYELAINSDQLRQFYVQLEGQMEEILRTESRLNSGESHLKVAYPTPTRDCSWKCQYFDICGAMNDVHRNDVNYLVAARYSRPEEREATRLEELRAQARFD